MTLKKDFLWGGAVAAHQLEGGWNAGGKGVSVADVMIAGSNGVERKITDGVIEEKIIRIMKLLIFIIATKKILHSLMNWD